MSIWETFRLEEKILGILDVQSYAPDHHFGRPYLTPYQIAIAFQNQYPVEFQAIGKPVGGEGTGQHDSLAQYIALELSRKIRDEKLPAIEGRFLCRQNLLSLRYRSGNSELTSSQSYDLSMFRLRT